MRIVFVGPPGAGKGTQAQRLKDYLRVVHLSSGDMLRRAHQAGSRLGREAAEYFLSGKLVPDNVVVGIMLERLTQRDCANGCLFDGFPRTVSQAQALDALLAEHGMPLDLALEIHVPDDVIYHRLGSRGRADDNLETARERLAQYRSLTEPILDYYRRQGILRSVDGQGSQDEVFERIKQVVDAASLTPD